MVAAQQRQIGASCHAQEVIGLDVDRTKVKLELTRAHGEDGDIGSLASNNTPIQKVLLSCVRRVLHFRDSVVQSSVPLQPRFWAR